MAVEISLAQFSKIATGDYNAGQIDFKTKEDGTGWFAGEATRVQAVKDDALQMAGDNSYQIDIGV